MNTHTYTHKETTCLWSCGVLPAPQDHRTYLMYGGTAPSQTPAHPHNPSEQAGLCVRGVFTGNRITLALSPGGGNGAKQPPCNESDSHKRLVSLLCESDSLGDGNSDNGGLACRLPYRRHYRHRRPPVVQVTPHPPNLLPPKIKPTD